MNEPNAVLRWVIYHFAGSDAFLCGLSVFVIAQGLLIALQSRRAQWMLVSLARIGLVWAVIDLPPVSWVLLVMFLCFLTGGWIAKWRTRKQQSNASTKSQCIYRILLSCCALFLIAGELPHRWFQRPVGPPKSLWIVGDSITAGLNDGEDTWPRRLSRMTLVKVFDASQPGATLKSAHGQVQRLNPYEGELLFLEIGGNDLLEGLPIGQFESDLNRLLEAATAVPERAVIMIELPRPPLSTRYGEIQRRLARQYHVQLVPCHYLLQVLTSQGSTVDGIHLSAVGHERLAVTIFDLLKFRGSSSHGEYRQIQPKGAADLSAVDHPTAP